MQVQPSLSDCARTQVVCNGMSSAITSTLTTYTINSTSLSDCLNGSGSAVIDLIVSNPNGNDSKSTEIEDGSKLALDCNPTLHVMTRIHVQY